jgi:hypothetical protein
MGVSAALVPFLVAVGPVGSSAVPHANPKANSTDTTARFIPRSYTTFGSDCASLLRIPCEAYIDSTRAEGAAMLTTFAT